MQHMITLIGPLTSNLEVKISNWEVKLCVWDIFKKLKFIGNATVSTRLLNVLKIRKLPLLTRQIIWCNSHLFLLDHMAKLTEKKFISFQYCNVDEIQWKSRTSGKGRQESAAENKRFAGRLSGWVNRLTVTGPWMAVTGRKQREAPALKGEVTRKRCVSAACRAL